VLAGDGGTVSTATLLAEVGSGRYRAEVPAGMYL
jgi:cell division protease FtsH